MKRRAVLALAFTIALATRSARADERTSTLDAPAPPTLPALAHKDITYTFEYTAAFIEPSEDARANAAVRNAVAWFAHNEIELPLVPRKWYLGVAHDLAAGSVPGVGRDFFLGNPEIIGRGLWSSVVGLSSGGGLGLVLPAPRSILKDEDKVLHTVRVVRPWDAAYFTDLTLTVRPWFDIRHIAGRFIIQLRQGLDWSIVTRALKETEHRQEFTARATFYLGYRVHERVGVGLELWELYQLTADVDDGKRAATSISPSVRFILPRVEPALSLLFPIATPLKGEAASYAAVRLNLGFTFDTTTKAKLASSRGNDAPAK